LFEQVPYKLEASVEVKSLLFWLCAIHWNERFYQIILHNDLGAREFKVLRQRVNLDCAIRLGVAHVAGIGVVLQIRDHGESVCSRRHSTLESQLRCGLVNGKEVLASIFDSQSDFAVRRQPIFMEIMFSCGPCHGNRRG